MARSVGSARLVFTAWIIGGLIVFFGAFCYAELGAAFPKAGGRTFTSSPRSRSFVGISLRVDEFVS